MKKYFKMIGWILLFGGIYYFFQFVVGMIVNVIAILVNFDKVNDPNFMVEIVFSHLNWILIIAMILSLGIYGLIFWLRKRNMVQYCKMKSTSGVNLMTIGLVGIAINILSIILINMTQIYKLSVDQIEVMNQLVMGNGFLMPLLVVGILVPVFEEILFRGIIFNELRENLSIWPALIIQALIFGVYHLNIVQGVFTFFLALIAGLLYLWSDSIWAPVTLHMFYNSINVTISHFLPEGFNPNGLQVGLIFTISLGIVIIAMVFLRKRRLIITDSSEVLTPIREMG